MAALQNRWLVLLVCLIAVGYVLAAPGVALAQDEWKVTPPQNEKDLETMGQGKGLPTVSSLFIYVVRWLFGIIGLLLGVAALFTGAQIAFSAGGGGRREEALQRLWWLILGMGVSFGAWFLVGVLRGLFLG